MPDTERFVTNATTNWGGTYRYRADALHAPTSIDELADVLRNATSARMVATRHTFSGMPEASTMISLDRLGERFEIDRGEMTVTIDGAMTYERLVELLAPEGLALHNLASLVPLSVAGAVATATHGSGDTNGNLATAVVGLELVTTDGALRAIHRADQGDLPLEAIAVSLGAFGAVTAITLRVEPAFDVAQQVVRAIPLGDFVDSIDDVFASAYSVSAFTTWGSNAGGGAFSGREIEQVWMKQRLDDPRPIAPVLSAAEPARDAMHPVLGGDGSDCTEQFGRPGSWAERLPHFRAGALPSAGAELQSEYFVPREHAEAAVLMMAEIGDRIQPALLASELRTIAADDLWLSPSSGRASMGFHFTWKPDVGNASAAAALVEDALWEFSPKPHWGKLFTPGFSTHSPTTRRADAVALMAELDPRGVLVNGWMTAEGLR